MTTPPRKPDRGARDVDYTSIGSIYADFLTANPRVASMIHAALGDARTVINVRAGTGSHEPTDRPPDGVSLRNGTYRRCRKHR